jgi:hypothetical protein
MSEVNIIIRTADQTRKAEVTMAREHTGGDVIQAAVDNWSLPSDTDYALVNSSNGKSVLPDQSLDENTVKEGDILEVQPVLVAG